MSKTTSATIIVVILAAVGGFVFWKNGDRSGTDTYIPAEQTTPASEEQSSSSSAGTTDNSDGLNVGVKLYAMADITSHNNKSDCWSVVNGGVYNLTSWISNHPGGQQAILSICGKDGSAAFNGQHGGQQKQADILASFKIGEVK